MFGHDLLKGTAYREFPIATRDALASQLHDSAERRLALRTRNKCLYSCRPG